MTIGRTKFTGGEGLSNFTLAQQTLYYDRYSSTMPLPPPSFKLANRYIGHSPCH